MLYIILFSLDVLLFYEYHKTCKIQPSKSCFMWFIFIPKTKHSNIYIFQTKKRLRLSISNNGFGKASISKDNQHMKSSIDSVGPTLSPEPYIDTIAPTPEKSSIQSKLHKINSCSKKLKKSKLSSILRQNGEKKSVPTTEKAGINLLSISPIPKPANKTRRLSLKAPLKRKCSYSFAENTKEKTENTLKVYISMYTLQ